MGAIETIVEESDLDDFLVRTLHAPCLYKLPQICVKSRGLGKLGRCSSGVVGEGGGGSRTWTISIAGW